MMSIVSGGRREEEKGGKDCGRVVAVKQCRPTREFCLGCPSAGRRQADVSLPAFFRTTGPNDPWLDQLLTSPRPSFSATFHLSYFPTPPSPPFALLSPFYLSHF